MPYYIHAARAFVLDTCNIRAMLYGSGSSAGSLYPQDLCFLLLSVYLCSDSFKQKNMCQGVDKIVCQVPERIRLLEDLRFFVF